MKKQFVVIGLGLFGYSVVKTLAEANVDVLAIDMDEEKIEDISQLATHALALDATDEAVLKGLGLRNFDVAVICVGDIQSSILITLICKEQGVKNVIAKAQDDLHAKVLSKIGADKIVFPERDTGIRVANNLLASNIIDFIEIFKNYGMLEMYVPKAWVGKSLLQLNVRKNYDVSIIAIMRQDDINMNPAATDILEEKDVIIVLGSDDSMNKMKIADCIIKE